jgi:hypothetical protein
MSLKSVLMGLATVGVSLAASAVVMPFGSFLANECTDQDFFVRSGITQVCLGEIETQGQSPRPPAIEVRFKDGTRKTYLIEYAGKGRSRHPGLGATQASFTGVDQADTSDEVVVQGRVITTMGMQRTDHIEVQIIENGMTFRGELHGVARPMAM